MAHKLLAKDTGTGQCGWATPPCPPIVTAGDSTIIVTNTGTPQAPVYELSNAGGAAVIPPQPKFSFSSSAPQSVVSGVNAPMTNPNNGAISNSVGPPYSTFAGGVFTVGPNDGGFWHLNAEASFSLPGTTGQLRVTMLVNGTALPFVSGEKTMAGSATENRQKVAARQLNPGDTVQVQVFHNQGVNINVNVGEFSGFRVSA